MEKIGITPWEPAGTRLAISSSSESASTPSHSAISFSSAQKASRNQRMVRPVKKLIDSACAMPGMT
ncbi:hypothetical protein ACLFLT_00960 [Klebsiella pneumoniae]